MTDDLTPPHWGAEPITGPAQAWNTWWASVSSSANDKHMQTAFLAGYEASEARAREEGAKAMQAVGPALYQLRNHQQQADMDGTFVTVSRQALDEVLDAIAALDPAQIAGGVK